MATPLATMRRVVQQLGLDVQRYPQSDPLWSVAKLLRSQGVDLVLDVGANDGGYGRSIRRLGYEGRLFSFEPLTGPFGRLRACTAADPAWDSMRWAIGADEGNVTINIAGNSGASSSMLPMLNRHREASPGSGYVGVEEAPMKRLDDVVPTIGISPEDRTFLKIDVQGYEAAVLDGAESLLRSESIVGLQMELSLVPLYEGAMTWREGIERATALGMELMGLIPGFTEPSGRMLQTDAVFFLDP